MRNPTRRSRKIGKTQGGRVWNGKAYEKWSRIFTRSIWERLSEERQAGFTILRENPSSNYYHPCTSADIDSLVARLPKSLTEGLRAVIFRRITKIDRQRGVEARRRYRCIILNAFPKSNKVDWGTLPPMASAKRHYAPWCDGWAEENGRWVQLWTPDQAKRYYLYHLFLHELGHINEPSYHKLSRRESFAEDFALTWARKLKEL